jgi:hypothetical protein
MKMAEKTKRNNAELEKRIAAFTESSDLAPTLLLRTIEKWRHLQAGASDKKSPAYSSEQ